MKSRIISAQRKGRPRVSGSPHKNVAFTFKSRDERDRVYALLKEAQERVAAGVTAEFADSLGVEVHVHIPHRVVIVRALEEFVTNMRKKGGAA